MNQNCSRTGGAICHAEIYRMHGKMIIVGKCLTHTQRKEWLAILTIIMLCQKILMLIEMLVIV